MGDDRLVVATGSGLWYVDLADLGVEATAPDPWVRRPTRVCRGHLAQAARVPFGAALGDGVWAGDQMIVSAYGTKRIAGYGPRQDLDPLSERSSYELYGGSLTWTGTEGVLAQTVNRRRPDEPGGCCSRSIRTSGPGEKRHCRPRRERSSSGPGTSSSVCPARRPPATTRRQTRGPHCRDPPPDVGGATSASTGPVTSCWPPSARPPGSGARARPVRRCRRLRPGD